MCMCAVACHHNSYFRHYKAYKRVYCPALRMDISISNKQINIPNVLPALSSAMSESEYNVKVWCVMSMSCQHAAPTPMAPATQQTAAPLAQQSVSPAQQSAAPLAPNSPEAAGPLVPETKPMDSTIPNEKSMELLLSLPKEIQGTCCLCVVCEH